MEEDVLVNTFLFTCFVHSLLNSILLFFFKPTTPLFVGMMMTELLLSLFALLSLLLHCSFRELLFLQLLLLLLLLNHRVFSFFCNIIIITTQYQCSTILHFSPLLSLPRLIDISTVQSISSWWWWWRQLTVVAVLVATDDGLLKNAIHWHSD